MLKDLEVTLNTSRQIGATRGFLGGFIRRLAGDLSLWTLGAFVTIIATAVLVIIKSPNQQNDYAFIGMLVLVLLVFILAIATANIFVRRNGPTGLVRIFNNSRTIGFIYSLLLIILTARLLLGTA
jgi:phosphoglycerol transferase MdoB-like AlkP superfamily enzyme